MEKSDDSFLHKTACLFYHCQSAIKYLLKIPFIMVRSLKNQVKNWF